MRCCCCCWGCSWERVCGCGVRVGVVGGGGADLAVRVAHAPVADAAEAHAKCEQREGACSVWS